MARRKKEVPQEPIDYTEIFRQFSEFTETLSGMRNQLVNAGWSSEGAETIVIHMVMRGNAT